MTCYIIQKYAKVCMYAEECKTKYEKGCKSMEKYPKANGRSYKIM